MTGISSARPCRMLHHNQPQEEANIDTSLTRQQKHVRGRYPKLEKEAHAISVDPRLFDS